MIRNFSPKLFAQLSASDWLYVEDIWDPQTSLAHESLFTLCSGKMSSRAAHIEGQARPSLPAHYMHRLFDRSEALQRELVNMPDWSKLSIYSRRQPISPQTATVLSEYIRVLDLKQGFLAKHYIFEDAGGCRTELEIQKLLSRAYPNGGAIRVRIKPLNYSGLLEFENLIDATVTNFIDYPRFRVKHYEVREIRSLDGDGVAVDACTRDFQEAFSTQTAIRVSDEAGNELVLHRQYRPYGEVACEFFDLYVEEGKAYVIDKFAAVVAAHDGGDCRARATACLHNLITLGFDQLLEENRRIYAQFWERCEISIEGDKRSELALRLSLFHLMSTPNPHDSKSNIGAKLLHGEEYGGHAFWDTELFILPFYTLCFPEMAKRLLEYRYELLPAAIRYAAASDCVGARYPWESADTGDEECPLDTIAWDGTSEPCVVGVQELHVTADVVYGAYQYYRFTEDMDYYQHAFGEILFQTSRFWASRLEYDEATDSYGLSHIMGPDEWHEDIRDSVYTLELIRWQLKLALKYFREADLSPVQQALVVRLGISTEEVQDWALLAERIRPPHLNADGVIEEFAGYFELHDAVIEEFNEKGMPIFPQALRDYPREQTSIIKQADVLMWQYLFDEYFSMESKRSNFDYYQKRTLHGSSLSPSIHCIMGLRSGRPEEAYENFLRSALIDIEDKHRNTREGLHAAAAGGSWQCLVMGFAGLHLGADGRFHFSAQLPSSWQSLRFRLYHAGRLIEVHVEGDSVTLYCDAETPVHYVDSGHSKVSSPWYERPVAEFGGE
ncbi:MAG: glycosyl hydrolase family 65 protein [Eubacteriales bacterium]|nr:glycosyl hydrolase family 65 protein [Eubacteriales bacterium]